MNCINDVKLFRALFRVFLLMLWFDCPVLLCNGMTDNVSFDTSRIYHVMAKARRGEPVTIAAIGGSITAGSLASTENKRWINIVTAWWRNRFPASAITLVNAGIGGTGSDIGTFRVKNDILSKVPDFVIIEFSVNDSGKDSTYVIKMTEGLVRQLLQDTNKIGVMFLMLKMENGGTAQADHKVVANYYGIPWVSQADLIDAAVTADGRTLREVYGDNPGIHPNDLGMQYIADFINEKLDSIYNHLPSDENLPEIPAAIPEPLITDIYAETYTFKASTIIPNENSGWEISSFDWSSLTPGSELVFTIDGNAVAVEYSRHNATNRGRVEIWVDEGPHKILDAYWTETWGPARVFELIAENLTDGEHTLHIKVLNEHNPLSNGNYFQLLSVMKAGNITMARPIAVPGKTKKMIIATSLILDGSGSYDPDGDTITAYQWSIVNAPVGSNASLENENMMLATFTPDIEGIYTLGLIVMSASQNSVMRKLSVHVVSSNTVPVANAGYDFNTATGKKCFLNSTGSYDADNDSLLYNWLLVSKPVNSKSYLLKASTTAPYFTPDVEGEYVIILTVNDSITSSSPDTVIVNAIDGYSKISNSENEKDGFSVFPNPAPDIITVQYKLETKMPVRLTIYSAEGRMLAEFFNGFQDAGLHILTINLNQFVQSKALLMLCLEKGFISKIQPIIKI